MFSKYLVQKLGYLPQHAVRIYQRLKHKPSSQAYIHAALDECMSYLHIPPEWRCQYGGPLYRYIIGERCMKGIEIETKHVPDLCRLMLTYVIYLDWDDDTHMEYVFRLLASSNCDEKFPLLALFHAMHSYGHFNKLYPNAHSDIGAMFAYLYEYEYDPYYDPLCYRIADYVFDAVFEGKSPSPTICKSPVIFYNWLQKWCQYALRYYVKFNVTSHKMNLQYVLNDIVAYPSRKAFANVLRDICNMRRHNIREISLFKRNDGKSMITINIHRGDDDTFLKMFGIRPYLMRDVRQYKTRHAMRPVMCQLQNIKARNVMRTVLREMLEEDARDGRRDIIFSSPEKILISNVDGETGAQLCNITDKFRHVQNQLFHVLTRRRYLYDWTWTKFYTRERMFPELQTWSILVQLPYDVANVFVPVVVYLPNTVVSYDFFMNRQAKQNVHRELLLSRCFYHYTRGYHSVVSGLDDIVTPDDLNTNYMIKCRMHITGPFYQRLK